MSDQSFGRASRDAWDDAERLDEHRRRFEVRERIAPVTLHHLGVPISRSWSAADERTLDDDPHPVGWGGTEQDAIDDLIDKIMERST